MAMQDLTPNSLARRKLETVPQPFHEIHALVEHGDHDDGPALLNEENVVMAAMMGLHVVDRRQWSDMGTPAAMRSQKVCSASI